MGNVQTEWQKHVILPFQVWNMVFGPDQSQNLMIKIIVIDKITSLHLQKFFSENSE